MTHVLCWTCGNHDMVPLRKKPVMAPSKCFRASSQCGATPADLNWIREERTPKKSKQLGFLQTSPGIQTSLLFDFEIAMQFCSIGWKSRVSLQIPIWSKKSDSKNKLARWPKTVAVHHFPFQNWCLELVLAYRTPNICSFPFSKSSNQPIPIHSIPYLLILADWFPDCVFLIRHSRGPNGPQNRSKSVWHLLPGCYRMFGSMQIG